REPPMRGVQRRSLPRLLGLGRRGRHLEGGNPAQQHPAAEPGAAPTATDSLIAAGEQHWSVSASARVVADICSASPTLTYHSQGAPSGSLTHVSVLCA